MKMWIRIFVDYLRFERNLSEKTIEAYQADLEAFKQFYEAVDSSLTWEEMPADVIRQWVVEMMDKGNAATSVRRRLSSLRSFYKFLLRRGLVTRDPVHNLPSPKVEKKLPAYIREAEMDRLFDGDFFSEDYQGFRNRMILLTFYSTGIRLSELVGLAERDVDLDQMQLKVTGKRNKQRIIPFGEELAAELSRYIEKRNSEVERDSDALLVTKTGKRISRKTVYSRVKDGLSRVTSMKKRSPHVLRHSFATAMLNNEAGLESIRKLLGHESVATTEIYTHTTFEQLKKEYSKAHPRA